MTFTGDDERVDDRGALAGGWMTDEEPVLFANRGRPDGIFYSDIGVTRSTRLLSICVNEYFSCAVSTSQWLKRIKAVAGVRAEDRCLGPSGKSPTQMASGTGERHHCAPLRVNSSRRRPISSSTFCRVSAHRSSGDSSAWARRVRFALVRHVQISCRFA